MVMVVVERPRQAAAERRWAGLRLANCGFIVASKGINGHAR
jgi:hypothetical protein